MVEAKPILNIKRQYTGGAILQIVIWQVPQRTAERPHGYKYRLNYSLPDGKTVVRYDNEKRKGDHKHIQGVQHPYKFTSIRQLLLDFNADVIDNGGSL